MSIPIGGRSLRLDVPSEAISVRVTGGDTGAPVPQADVRWDSAGGTVRAHATATGDVLLDGVSRGRGRLSVTAEGYRPIERDLHAVPDVPLEVRLTRMAPQYVVVRVSDIEDEPIEDAVVYFDLHDRADDDQVAPTGPDGVATFNVRRPNALRVTAWAARYAPASKFLSLRDDAASLISITLRHSQQKP